MSRERSNPFHVCVFQGSDFKGYQYITVDSVENAELISNRCQEVIYNFTSVFTLRGQTSGNPMPREPLKCPHQGPPTLKERPWINRESFYFCNTWAATENLEFSSGGLNYERVLLFLFCKYFLQMKQEVFETR